MVKRNIPCPCGGTFGVTYDGRTDHPSGLTHSRPLCDRYVDLTAEEAYDLARAMIAQLKKEGGSQEPV